MASILCAAENFAYGPIGKLLTLAPGLAEKGHELHFVGYGTAYELAEQSRLFVTVTKMNTETEESRGELANLLCKHDLVVSCMDRRPVVEAVRRGVKAVWVDSLYYWWEDLPQEVLNSDLYIKQQVLPDGVGSHRFDLRVKNMHTVGPIVKETHSIAHDRSNRLLVCYGGMEAPGWYETGRNHNYAYVMTRLLLDSGISDSYDEVCFSGSQKIMSRLSDQYAGHALTFRSYPHEEFVQLLGESRVALLSGGLETSLEAFSSDTPAIFLPPLNVTQYLQVQHFRDHGAARASIQQADYYGIPFNENMDRREKVQAFLSQACRFEGDDKALADAGSRLSNWVRDPSVLEEARRGQREYFGALSQGGCDAAVLKIDSLVSDS
jgi:hypothetical protein